MKRKFILSAAFLLVILLAAYTALWFWAAGKIRDEMSGLIAEAQANGIQIMPRAMGVRGYPGKHEAWFSGRVAADGTVLEIPLLEVRSLFLPEKPLAIEVPEGFTVVEPADAEIWALDRLLVETVIPASLPADLTREDLTAWRDAGNVLTLSNIEAQKQSLALKGSGIILLDENLQPAGELTAHATGHMEFMIWLQQNGYVETKEALLATAVLSSLSKTDPETSRNLMEVALTLQSRTLFVGPLRLGVLPPVEWPWRSPPAPPQ